MNREMDPTRLGKRLSDITTRRVIVVVLSMIIFLPIMQTTTTDFSSLYGLKALYQLGRSNCRNFDDESCTPEVRDKIT